MSGRSSAAPGGALCPSPLMRSRATRWPAVGGWRVCRARGAAPRHGNAATATALGTTGATLLASGTRDTLSAAGASLHQAHSATPSYQHDHPATSAFELPASRATLEPQPQHRSGSHDRAFHASAGVIELFPLTRRDVEQRIADDDAERRLIRDRGLRSSTSRRRTARPARSRQNRATRAGAIPFCTPINAPRCRYNPSTPSIVTFGGIPSIATARERRSTRSNPCE